VLDNLSGFGALFPARRTPTGNQEVTPCDSEPPDQLDDPSELRQARSQVVGLLGPTPVKVDDLVRRCQLSPAAVLAVLLELELAGRVETLPGNRFALLADGGLTTAVP
jgi:DNA processing protein